ncbi:VgrG-related protein [Planotetraspora kaengkrachanensis]|uniref:Type IV secretion protein Rhs n=1 Tax=Planotetraspora kaengkrachanensis TaxID=575193 RepID=A0A8J3V9I3_9ACTN|nr:VgrG-related protein [Planotetraspora kaengkrachanensis]GIG82676.1 type IV secretion protein Rhs [Planotetraspora kaengkrachanensis]
MAAETFSSTLVVEVGGAELAPEIAALLVHGYVEDNRNLLDTFVLRFRDPGHLVVDKGGLTVGAKVTLKAQTSDPGPPVPLMTGEVAGLTLDLDAAGTITEVRGFDEAHRLMRGRRVAAYPNMTVGDVVRQVARRANIPVGRIDPLPGVGGRLHTQLSQDNVSDWTFLTRLADRVGAQVGVAEGRLFFRLPTPPSGAPGPSEKAEQNPLVLEADANLISLRASVTAASQAAEVEVRGWDYEHKQEITATATPALKEAGADPAELGRTFAAPTVLAGVSGHRTQAEVKAAADALAADLGGTAVELDGVAKGNPRLRAGVAVSLAGVGAPFAGKYTLSGTRHLFSPSTGYTTAFTVSGRQDRSLYGLTSRGASGTAHGLVPAIVSNIKDPLAMGRVCLTFPWLSGEFTSGWARVALPGAGRDRGLELLPEVGDEVLVGFENGDFDSPYVLGGLHNGTDTAPRLSAEIVDGTSGQVAVRALVSRAGHRLELVEKPGAVRLSTGDEQVTLTLDEKSGAVVIKAAKGVTVDAGSGSVEVTATSGITLDAGAGPLELKGSRVTVSGQSDVTVTGAIIKLN